MSRFLSLAEAVAETIRDGDTVAMEGFTHLIPHAAGHEIIRQRKQRLTLIRMTPDLIYDQLIGMGCVAKLVFSWGGNPGVGSLLPPARRGRERLAQPDRDRGALPRRHGQCLRGRRRRPAMRDLSRLCRGRPAQGQSQDQAHHLPVHRRGAGRRAGPSPRRRRHPCAARRPRRQRAARGHRGGAEGGGAGRPSARS